MELQKASLSELLVQLVQQVEQLLSAHLRRARQELAEDGKRFAAQSVGVILGGILALQGITFLGLSGYKALSIWIPAWGAALIVALLFLGGGAALAFVDPAQLRGQGACPCGRFRRRCAATRWADSASEYRRSTP